MTELPETEEAIFFKLGEKQTATVRYGMPTTFGSRFPEWTIALPSIIPPMA